MWKQLIVPTLVVSGLWLLVSPATTYSLYLLDQSYQAALNRHLGSTQAAGKMREHVWRLLSYADSPGLGRILPETTVEVERALRELEARAQTDIERPLVKRLSSEWQVFVNEIREAEKNGRNVDRTSRHRKLRNSAETVAATINQLRDVTGELWTAAEQYRERWMEFILTTRSVLVVIGPVIGIAVGWWMGLRLHQSISQINIILKDAAAGSEENLAELTVQGREDLPGLRGRVEKIVERMRQVSTELAAARRETVRSERLAAVGELAAGIAHELRNPLTSVKLLLQNATQPNGEARLHDEESRVVLDEISRMEEAIQGLLDLSRPPSAQRRRHDLRDTLHRAWNLVQGRAKQQHIQITMDLPDVPLMVDGDSEQLHQVCVNLLINGVEAMSTGGVLEVHGGTDAAGSKVLVGFRDHGPGIPHAVLHKMFEPFVSTKAYGTGLGLAISRRIVTQHGGKLDAENHVGGGALLTLELPAVGDEEPRQVALVPGEAPVSAGA